MDFGLTLAVYWDKIVHSNFCYKFETLEKSLETKVHQIELIKRYEYMKQIVSSNLLWILIRLKQLTYIILLPQ